MMDGIYKSTRQQAVEIMKEMEDIKLKQSYGIPIYLLDYQHTRSNPINDLLMSSSYFSPDLLESLRKQRKMIQEDIRLGATQYPLSRWQSFWLNIGGSIASIFAGRNK